MRMIAQIFVDFLENLNFIKKLPLPTPSFPIKLITWYMDAPLQTKDNIALESEIPYISYAEADALGTTR